MARPEDAENIAGRQNSTAQNCCSDPPACSFGRSRKQHQLGYKPTTGWQTHQEKSCQAESRDADGDRRGCAVQIVDAIVAREPRRSDQPRETLKPLPMHARRVAARRPTSRSTAKRSAHRLP